MTYWAICSEYDYMGNNGVQLTFYFVQCKSAYN